MTMTEALGLKAGDLIERRAGGGLPGAGVVRITLASPARPEMGYAPAVSGRDVSRPNVTFCVILDGKAECLKALSYWAKK